MPSDVYSPSGGIGFFGALTVLFVGLKLAGLLHWSWYFVLMPLWVPGVSVLGLIGLLLLIDIKEGKL